MRVTPPSILHGDTSGTPTEPLHVQETQNGYPYVQLLNVNMVLKGDMLP